VVFLLIGGRFVLSLLGSGYDQEGYDLLVVLSVSSFPLTLFLIYSSILKVDKNMRQLVVLSGLALLILLSSSYVLATWMGLIGVGYSWLLTYGVCAVIIAVELPRSRARKGGD
jgi:O-antigen/teichoic acid export membrane protein